MDGAVVEGESSSGHADEAEVVGGGEDSDRPLYHCGKRFKRMLQGCLLLTARSPVVNTC